MGRTRHDALARIVSAEVLLAALAALVGCKWGADGSADPTMAQDDEIPVIVHVELHPQIHLDRAKADLENAVAAATVSWLREPQGRRLGVGLDRPLGAGIRVDLTEDLRRFVIDESLRLRHARKWPLEVIRTHLVPTSPAGVDLAEVLETGVRAALVLLAEMASLFDRSDAELEAVVRRTDGPADLRILAVRILQDRDADGAVPVLVDAFRDAPEALRLTIIDAMGTLGAPRHIPDLLAVVDGRKVDEISRTLRSIALVGGEDARQFARWIALGHPDERVQRTAEEAFLQIRDAEPAALP